jgi:t-SNARE complex subunit (syntaxin)
VEERETVDGCLRQMDFLEPELAELERLIALASPEVTRLMSVVNVIARSVRDWQQRTRAPTRHGGRASSSRLSRKQRGEASVSDPAL